MHGLVSPGRQIGFTTSLDRCVQDALNCLLKPILENRMILINQVFKVFVLFYLLFCSIGGI